MAVETDVNAELQGMVETLDRINSDLTYAYLKEQTGMLGEVEVGPAYLLKVRNQQAYDMAQRFVDLWRNGYRLHKPGKAE